MALDWKYLIEASETSGIRLEVVQGVPTWEFSTASIHQITLRAIDRSLRPFEQEGDCGCFGLQDTYIRFPDGSLKRPDPSIFCEEPPRSHEALTVIPVAVVEVVSRGFEEKDRVGAELYLRHGVRDVVVVNPDTKEVNHFHSGRVDKLTSPVTISLTVGCKLDA